MLTVMSEVRTGASETILPILHCRYARSTVTTLRSRHLRLDFDDHRVVVQVGVSPSIDRAAKAAISDVYLHSHMHF